MLAGQPSQPPCPPSRYMATLSKFKVLIAYSTPPGHISFMYIGGHLFRHTDISIVSFLAFGDIRVSDQVTKTVGFDNKSDLGRRVLLDNSSNGINVCLVLGKTIICDGQLSVGSKSGTIAVGQIIDHEGANDLGLCTSSILLLDISEISIHGRYFGGGITSIVSMDLDPALPVRLTAKQRFQSLQQRLPWLEGCLEELE
jgi:hypothetical protein